MKSIRNLNTIVSIFFYLLLISLLFSVVFIPIGLFFGAAEGIEINGYTSADFRQWQIVVAILIALGEFALFVYAIYQIRRSMPLLMEGNIYDNRVVSCFMKARKYFIVVGLSSIAFRFIGGFVLLNELSLGISFTTNTFLFIAMMGFFFSFFSEVLKKGKLMKEENDLTI